MSIGDENDRKKEVVNDTIACDNAYYYDIVFSMYISYI